jgi:arylsulfatase
MPMLSGPKAMPGPADTFIAYGLNWANVSNTPFREYKHFVHEGGIATPLIAHWPKGIKRAGEMEHTPGHLIDVMATAVDVAGAKYPQQRGGKAVPAMEGKSLAPAFEGKAVEREALYWEHEGNRAVRVGKWKVVAKGPRGKWELYDMSVDRSEMNDLAEREPERVKEMVGKWEAWAKRANAVPWPWRPQYGEEAASQQKVFELKRGDNLTDAAAPDIEGKGLTISASVTVEGDGVIVAQGGNLHGVALYVREGKLEFAVRRAGEIVSVSAPEVRAKEKVEVSAVLAKDGAMTLSVGGKVVASGKSPGVVLQNPGEGLTVGRDPAGAVGRYQTPNRFGGTIHSAKLELQ